jgi:hypothetical protein
LFQMSRCSRYRKLNLTLHLICKLNLIAKARGSVLRLVSGFERISSRVRETQFFLRRSRSKGGVCGVHLDGVSAFWGVCILSLDAGILEASDFSASEFSCSDK